MSTITSRHKATTGQIEHISSTPAAIGAMARKGNGNRAGNAKQKCTEVRKSMEGDNYDADPLSLSNHLSPLSSPIMTLFQSLNVDVVCEPKSPYNYYYKSLERESSAQQDDKPENYTIRTARTKKYASATRSAPSVDADDDTTVAASGSGRNVKKRSQSLIGGTDEQCIIAGKIFSLGDEIARTEAKLVELKREKQKLEHLLKENSQATFGQPPIHVYTSAPTLPSKIDMKPSRRRRRVKSFEAGRPTALPNDGDLFEKTIAAAKRAQSRALWKEREVDVDVFSLLHLWESIEIGGEKDDNTSSPNRSQISDSNMPEKKQLFPRSA